MIDLNATAEIVKKEQGRPLSCAHCAKRPGTEIWVGEMGMLGLSHGMSQMWCKICVLETQLDHAKKQAAKVPELEAELAEEIKAAGAS